VVAKEREWDLDALPRGTWLNGYQLAEIIGRGGFGITYKAVDGIDQAFAIKECLPRQFAMRQGTEVRSIGETTRGPLNDCLARFTREARALRQLSTSASASGGVVKVATLFEANGTAYIVMEFLSGPSLAEMIAASPGGIDGSLLKPMMIGLLRSLSGVHRAGFLHRDIKPANILMRGDGHPVLIDFGAVRAASGGNATTYTQIYSENYAPIEQLVGSQQGTFSDIFALGATFYRAIGGTLVDAYSRHNALLRGQPDPQMAAARIGAGRYEPAVLRAIDAALTIEPEARPQSADQLLALLSDADEAMEPTVLAGSTPVTRVEPASAPKPAPPPKPSSGPQLALARPGRIGVAALGVLVFATAAVVALFAFRSPAPPAPSAGRSIDGGSSSTEVTGQGKGAVSRGSVASDRSPPVPPPAVPAPTPSAGELVKNGRAASQRQDYAEAMDWFGKAADLGSAEAMVELAELHAFGRGVPQDDVQAFRWYARAAELGNALAMGNVGYFYQAGRGVPRDDREAVRWYRGAADLGNTGAMIGLGTLYDAGLGVSKDYAEAMRWYRRAADLGDPNALFSVGRLLDDGYGARTNYAEAVDWYRKGAARNNADAIIGLGRAYHLGHGVPPDDVEAIRWYRKAAALGKPEAMSALGFFYEEGKSVPSDYAEALRWYRKAAALGSGSAMGNIGYLYEHGRGVPQDRAEARRWYEEGVARGDEQSSRRLKDLGN
jgi:TPR repeat protein